MRLCNDRVNVWVYPRNVWLCYLINENELVRVLWDLLGIDIISLSLDNYPKFVWHSWELLGKLEKRKTLEN